MITGVFTEAPRPPAAMQGPSPLPNSRDITTPCDQLGIEPPRSDAPKASPSLEELKAQAKEAEQKAKTCGVDMAKRSFFTKMIALVAASAVLITAALITGFTAGAGIPLLALASVGFAIAVGDVACAAYDWHNKKNGGEGLPMGSDAIGNAIYGLGKACGASDEKARQVATYGSLLARSAITLGTVAVGGFLPVAAPEALQTVIPALTLGSMALGERPAWLEPTRCVMASLSTAMRSMPAGPGAALRQPSANTNGWLSSTPQSRGYPISGRRWIKRASFSSKPSVKTAPGLLH
ncbi:protein EseG [Edwardsiella ictaluri]|uniref:Protein EseG n=1 Tax=Edwardsiella ictaluri TaxID=67780 RepID=A0ABY8GE28_EDWIC|nr:protein EseG [Edwardsiella ictaluri]WFN95572.1 protein EseG [Edwardsiella ictaluri]